MKLQHFYKQTQHLKCFKWKLKVCVRAYLCVSLSVVFVYKTQSCTQICLRKMEKKNVGYQLVVSYFNTASETFRDSPLDTALPTILLSSRLNRVQSSSIEPVLTRCCQIRLVYFAPNSWTSHTAWLESDEFERLLLQDFRRHSLWLVSIWLAHQQFKPLITPDTEVIPAQPPPPLQLNISNPFKGIALSMRKCQLGTYFPLF
jgi:hypothetical protein